MNKTAVILFVVSGALYFLSRTTTTTRQAVFSPPKFHEQSDPTTVAEKEAAVRKQQYLNSLTDSSKQGERLPYGVVRGSRGRTGLIPVKDPKKFRSLIEIGTLSEKLMEVLVLDHQPTPKEMQEIRLAGRLATWPDTILQKKPRLTVEDFCRDAQQAGIVANVRSNYGAPLQGNRRFRKMEMDEYCKFLTTPAEDGEDRPYVGSLKLDPPDMDAMGFGWPFQKPLTDFHRPALWFGPADSFTPLHVDPRDNIAVQLHGTKKWWFVPPWQDPDDTGYSFRESFLINKTGLWEDGINSDALFSLASFSKHTGKSVSDPKYKQTSGLQVLEWTQNAGYAMYVPSMWGHVVVNPTISIMLNFWYIDLPGTLAKRNAEIKRTGELPPGLNDPVPEPEPQLMQNQNAGDNLRLAMQQLNFQNFQQRQRGEPIKWNRLQTGGFRGRWANNNNA
eukprot:TRINITY_DN3583_c0_g1_i1.p2 TRINITY_DN3583_c0_g1~~TRINITY_DN3583_c0_g1_i1.p2  ORF type:complete len:446 (-),score=53.18 TRINITY_DN3583_c0_g1_i1:2232-3569(-)